MTTAVAFPCLRFSGPSRRRRAEYTKSFGRTGETKLNKANASAGLAFTLSRRERPELKHSRYLWLRNERRLSVEQITRLAELTRLHLKTVRAYRLRLAFQEIYTAPSHDWGELILNRWYSWAIRSRLEPMKKVARTIKQHRDGILRWFDSKIANGLIEGINSLVQAAKAKARGYRSLRNLMAIIYLITGKIDLKLAHLR